MKPSQASNKKFVESEMMDRRAEEALILRCRQGQRVAFNEIVEKYHQRVFAVALGMLGDHEEAKDVAQDTFIQVYRAIGTFRGESKFSTWLLSITINLCKQRRRWWARRKERIVVSLDDPVETQKENILRQVADQLPTSAALVMNAELKQKLITALRKLKEPGRTMLVLRGIKELSYKDIAQVLGCRIENVKWHLNQARLRLRGLLEEELK